VDHNPGPEPAQGATVRTVQHSAAVQLRAAGIESARLDARILAGAAWGLGRDQLLCRADDPVGAEALERFDALLARRLAREPVSRILGRREFWSLDFGLSAETLDPRPDSETVIEAALDALGGRPEIDILDLGTGTGCLLLALLSELPAARGLGLDLSAGAVTVATANAARLDLAGRARFECRDWRDGLGGRLTPAHFGLVVANPPYIPRGEIAGLAPEVARFEPAAALDGGADGLDAYRCLALQLPGLLIPGGNAVFEVGAGQAAAVSALLDAAGLTVSDLRRDLAGIERCVIARAAG